MKTSSKQRKVFDVRAARVAGTEMEKYVLKKPPGTEAPVVFNYLYRSRKAIGEPSMKLSVKWYLQRKTQTHLDLQLQLILIPTT